MPWQGVLPPRPADRASEEDIIATESDRLEQEGSTMPGLQDRADPRRRHQVAVVVFEGTLSLDLAIAVQTFGNRPTLFQRIRAEPESPYEVVICGRAPIGPGSLGLTVTELASLEYVTTADTV